MSIGNLRSENFLNIDFDTFDNSGNYNCVCCNANFYHDFYDKNFAGLLIGDHEYYGLGGIQEPTFCSNCLGINSSGKLDKGNERGLFCMLCTGCPKYKTCSCVSDEFHGAEFNIYEFDYDMEIEDICEEFGEYETAFVCRIDYTNSINDNKIYAFRCEKIYRFVLFSTEHFGNNGIAKTL